MNVTISTDTNLFMGAAFFHMPVVLCENGMKPVKPSSVENFSKKQMKVSEL